MSRKSISRICLLVFLLVLPSSAASAWRYSPDGDEAMGTLTGGIQGTLVEEHPQDMDNEFWVYKKGASTLFVDSGSRNVWVKTPLVSGRCAWKFYQSNQKFQEKYFLGLPLKQYESDCKKP